MADLSLQFGGDLAVGPTGDLLLTDGAGADAAARIAQVADKPW